MKTLNEIVLPAGLNWNDLNYTPVLQGRTDSLTGRAILQRGRMVEGRPILLTGSAESCWLTRAEAVALAELRNLAEMMTLNIHGKPYNVRFDYANKEHLALAPLHGSDDTPADADTWTLTQLALIEVIN